MSSPTFSLQFTHSKHFKDILMKRKESPRTTRSVSSSSAEEEENDANDDGCRGNEDDNDTTALSTRRRRNKNNNAKSSERSANESKATTTGKFLSRLLAEEKENEERRRFGKETRKGHEERYVLMKRMATDVKEIGRTFEDDDDCKNPLIKGGDIRFIEASGKRTPTVRRVECKKKKEKTKRREHTTTEEGEEDARGRTFGNGEVFVCETLQRERLRQGSVEMLVRDDGGKFSR